MKAFQVILLLCLIASLSCKEFIDYLLCLISDPKISGFIAEIIELIKNKAPFGEYLKLISKIMEVVNAGKKCLAAE